MTLSLAYSPCPNDTFAFHAMVNGLVDTEGLNFYVELADVEQLNKSAAEEKYDVCKLSYHAFFYLCDRYAMLRSGSALGYNNGPLFVSERVLNGQFSGLKIAIPGEKTTAALLLKIAYPECTNLAPIIFSQIEERVLSGEFDAGVLIHEGRFTYAAKGLKLIEDLGTYWQTKTGKPIPLGGIAVSRKLSLETGQKVNRVLRRSIEFAFRNPELSKDYICSNARELDPDIQKRHIELFVNEYSTDIGESGIDAVYSLYDKALEIEPKIIKRDNLFIS
ncbi:MAG: 1,4-dihydroxy-6-naphthoate synthase [Bacteroidales bacterium]|jgi:1,4-dihydroxy-6-naphthoate synthase